MVLRRYHDSDAGVGDRSVTSTGSEMRLNFGTDDRRDLAARSKTLRSDAYYERMRVMCSRAGCPSELGTAMKPMGDRWQQSAWYLFHRFGYFLDAERQVYRLIQ